jgi:hypothetical protein
LLLSKDIASPFGEAHRHGVMRVAILFCAVYYTVVGALLFFAPGFFYQHIGHIGLFNPHYERDAGSFILPIGIGLFFAVRDPLASWRMTTLAAVASTLHAISHTLERVHSTAEAIELAFFWIVAIVLFVPIVMIRTHAQAHHDARANAR